MVMADSWFFHCPYFEARVHQLQVSVLNWPKWPEAYPTAGLCWGRAFWRFFSEIDLNFCVTLLHSLVIWLWHAFFFWVCVYSAWGHPMDRSWKAWIICICWHSCLDIPSKLMVSQENSFNSIVWYCAIVYLKCLISFFKEMVWCLGYEWSICVCS